MIDFDASIKMLDGSDASLRDYEGKVLLLVNVASKCGLTKQYTALEALQQKYQDQGFTVLGFPCNQFGGQEPGSAEEIQEFCSATFGVTFPIFEKIEVNGENRHPLYEALTAVSDSEGEAGDVKWNFEKYIINKDGSIRARVRPPVTPDDPTVVDAIESALAE